jgi:tartrate dehydrogenase/decarboxylase/D-malate dehydrogenase
MIWSGALMLDYLGRGMPAANQKPYLDAHDAIVKAIEQVLSQGPHTPDLGGKANTTQIGEAVSKVLSH